MLTDGRDAAFGASRPLLRSAGFAVVALPVSLASHVAAGGATPDEATLLLAFALAALGHRAVLAPRERSCRLIVLALGAAQAGLHVLFGGSGHVGGSGHEHAATAGGHQSAAHAGSALLAGHAGLTMIVGHAVAAAVLGWFLHQGERALWAAARRAVRVVRDVGGLVRRLGPALLAALLLAAPPHVPRGPECSAAADTRATPSRRLRALGGRFWRGPPLLVFVD